ncbi:uroporphyrinogen-III C-methyltransferase [Candidatus Atelocyanobacterium thalassae]|uniref:uroporphyrinogen-III C-methyltransferase n=2 Tax=Candidatus Atelocyanobacterium thalassae TaxID=713887 RepID=A0A086CFY4_9CHRO|nr:uroporphyrinogen-III C-methyltransferase [Candidatus Atelocyanobacterium thalassa]KFF41098.1 MAG: uroporphyrinogen-III C-methyltransferase [Candidatus Atelocyanobacterium thalassa isolate SIO64986]BDA39631.1 uroporphyrinogen-III C-methyltransferase [cyanobacterium endosymbiont of Braarudosphaera bigelowii]
MKKISKMHINKVYLVGSGPGDPNLMTIKGKNLLEHADVVVYDALISSEILSMINNDAIKINVGKRRGNHSKLQIETTKILIEQAKRYSVVVRLKGGDPFVFGRGGEEMEDLINSGISVEIVPGITSGIAAPAYAGIPITHRRYSSSVTFVTGHEAVGKYRSGVNWSAVANGAETIVIYMGIHNLANIVTQLLLEGLISKTPIALIRWGTLLEQEQLVSTLGLVIEQVKQKGFQAPAIAIVGNVIKLQKTLNSSI